MTDSSREPTGEQCSNKTGHCGAVVLTLVLLAGLLLRAGYLASIWHAPDFASPVLDPQLNDYWARAIVTGDWSPPAHADDPEIRTTPYGRPPGYPYFLAAVYRFLGLNYGAPRIAQTFLGLVNLLLLYFLGKAWFGRRAGLAAAALGAVFWPFIYFEGELNSPVLEVFLYLAMAGALWKWFTSGRWDWALFAGMLLGLHALVRPNVLLPGVLAAAWMAWAAWASRSAPPVVGLCPGKAGGVGTDEHGLAQTSTDGSKPAGDGAWLRHAVSHAAVFLLAAVAVISPALVRNWRVAHEFVLISYYGGVNAYIGNNPNSTGDSPKMADLRELAGQAEWNCFNYPQLVRGLAEKQGLPDASFSGASSWFYRRTLDFWATDPLSALSLTARKAALFWGPEEVSDSKVVAVERDRSALLRWLPGFPALLALALLWLILVSERKGGPGASGTPRFGTRDSMALFAALLLMLAGAPIAVMLAVMWAVIARAWLGESNIFPAPTTDLRLAPVPGSPPSKGDLGGCGVVPYLLFPEKSPFEGGFRGMCAVSLAVTLILGHFLSVLPFFIAGRYRVPVTPFLILFGAAAIARIAHWIVTPGQRRRALIGATAGIALYGAACIPVATYTPSLSTWHYHSGVALADAGKPGPAADEFRAALHLDQQNAAAWLRLGYARAASGDAAGAMDAYTNAVIVAPDNALAHNNLGWELQKAGQADNARKEYERALAVEPRLEIAAINLCNLLVQAGERDKAVAVYEQLLQKNPKAMQARKNLEELTGVTAMSAR